MSLSVADAAREHPRRAALVDDAGTLSFDDLAREVERRGAALRAAGLRTGERVMLAPTPGSEGALSLLTLVGLSIPFALVHPQWTEREVDDAAARVRPRLLLRDRKITRAYGGDAAKAEPGQVVVFTSGSTGRPKAARLSRRALTAAAAAHASALPFEPDDRWLLAMPLGHVGGLSVLTRSLFARRAVVLSSTPRFDEEALRGALERHRVTLVSLVPTMLERLLEGPRPAASLRAVLLGGAACPDALLARGRAAGWPLLPTYGLSEACAQVCTQRADDLRPSGVGLPLPGVEVRIRDEQIEVRGPTLMDGFDEDTLSPGSWYRTGDIGFIDAAGHLHVGGRLDQRIVTGGENVDPLEVERALSEHPGITGVVVVGLADPTWGEVVAALVAGPTRTEPEALRRHLEPRLARFKHPRRWAFVERLPTLPNGKIDRQAARARLAL